MQFMASFLPFQLQSLIPSVIDSNIVNLGFKHSPEGPIERVHVRCAQALGPDIYIGSSDGGIFHYSLQTEDADKLQSYTLVSRKTISVDKPVDEIVLIPSLSRALVLSDNQLHFHSIPSLDPLPIKPIRHAVAFAVDDHHLKRPQASAAPARVMLPVDPVDFCVVKKSGVALYTLKDRLIFHKEIPFQLGSNTLLAKRAGHALCIADKTFYNMVDLRAMSRYQLLPLSQASEPAQFDVKPSITVISPNEFLLLSWTGISTLGLFVTDEGEPVRGTLEWSSHPEAICLDYPYITSLLQNNTIEVHDLESQAIVQSVGFPSSSKSLSPIRNSPHQRQASSSSVRSWKRGVDTLGRTDLISSAGGYLVPSTEKLEKMRRVPVKLLRS